MGASRLWLHPARDRAASCHADREGARPCGAMLRERATARWSSHTICPRSGPRLPSLCRRPPSERQPQERAPQRSQAWPSCKLPEHTIIIWIRANPYAIPSSQYARKSDLSRRVRKSSWSFARRLSAFTATNLSRDRAQRQKENRLENEICRRHIARGLTKMLVAKPSSL